MNIISPLAQKLVDNFCFSEIVVIGQPFSNSGKLRHGPPKIQSRSDGELCISENLSIRKMRLCQIVTCVVSVNLLFVFQL